MHPQSITLPFEDERFWAKVDFDGPIPEHHPELGSCWLWTGSLNEWGYGQLGRSGIYHRAHRYSYEQAYGAIPDGMLVCHHCDTPACVNPTHFFLDTNLGNMRDAIAKGRHVTRRYRMGDILPCGDAHWTHERPGESPVIGKRGEENPCAKLTDDDVREIRRCYAAGGVTQKALGREYGVDQVAISCLLHRKTWKHVD